MKVQSVTVRKNSVGAGWFVLVMFDDGHERSMGGPFDELPIFDITQVLAISTAWTAKMLLDREIA